MLLRMFYKTIIGLKALKARPHRAGRKAPDHSKNQNDNVEVVKRLLSAHKDLAKFELAQLRTPEYGEKRDKEGYMANGCFTSATFLRK
ncbi:hypothetical protein TrVGV298_012069 [Trichoderma virens]|nr:hypothetical protein TrVGV298_012069 [Trichoderma virens]